METAIKGRCEGTHHKPWIRQCGIKAVGVYTQVLHGNNVGEDVDWELLGTNDYRNREISFRCLWRGRVLMRIHGTKGFKSCSGGPLATGDSSVETDNKHACSVDYLAINVDERDKH